jgi:hypothetical protein
MKIINKKEVCKLNRIMKIKKSKMDIIISTKTVHGYPLFCPYFAMFDLSLLSNRSRPNKRLHPSDKLVQETPNPPDGSLNPNGSDQSIVIGWGPLIRPCDLKVPSPPYF